MRTPAPAAPSGVAFVGHRPPLSPSAFARWSATLSHPGLSLSSHEQLQSGDFAVAADFSGPGDSPSSAGLFGAPQTLFILDRRNR